MNASVLQGSRAVILELNVEAPSDRPPSFQGLLLSSVRASGSYEAGCIEVAADGIPQAFDGGTWRAEWRRNGKRWILRLGIPDVLFSESFDAVTRFSLEPWTVEASGRAEHGSILSVTVLPPTRLDLHEMPAWMPGAQFS